MVDTIPVSASMYRDGMYIGIEMPAFYTSLNTGRTSQFRVLLVGTKKIF